MEHHLFGAGHKESSLRVLRAVHALSKRDVEPSWHALFAVVPESAARIFSTVLALDAEGYLDAETLRLTLRGFAAVQLPAAVAYERRRNGRLRGAARVA